MIQNIRASYRLLLSITGIGLISVLAACQNPSTTTTLDPASPDSSVAQSPNESPAMSQSPAMGQSPAAGQGSQTLAALIDDDASFSTLKKLISDAGLEDQLQQPTPVTVFAPTNEAFAALPKGTLEKLSKAENRETLRQIISYHIVPGSITSATIKPGEVNSAQGQPLTIASDANGVTVNSAKVTQPDITASNGVIHAVNQVLIPPGTAL
jgi:uncharacterized surface protein with fasciclin (FAS1) repeats